MNQIHKDTSASNSQEFEQAISALSKITSRSPEEIKPHLERFLSELSSKPDVSKNHFFDLATDDEWMSAFRDWSESHKAKKLPVLSEAAMSRESMYSDRW
ncbi:hypothetical protein [Pleurocapsa sp. FMAR1]|uniref:hypothetical protein n=1 Tax=Pleurocapsa sp. FMAR1 TaxID=3040204 RepID=UPI0029C92B06|nr:hypothetical protein [Pleurocapsa sp. FMAR1]